MAIGTKTVENSLKWRRAFKLGRTPFRKSWIVVQVYINVYIIPLLKHDFRKAGSKFGTNICLTNSSLIFCPWGQHGGSKKHKTSSTSCCKSSFISHTCLSSYCGVKPNDLFTPYTSWRDLTLGVLTLSELADFPNFQFRYKNRVFLLNLQLPTSEEELTALSLGGIKLLGSV